MGYLVCGFDGVVELAISRVEDDGNGFSVWIPVGKPERRPESLGRRRAGDESQGAWRWETSGERCYVVLRNSRTHRTDGEV